MGIGFQVGECVQVVGDYFYGVEWVFVDGVYVGVGLVYCGGEGCVVLYVVVWGFVFGEVVVLVDQCLCVVVLYCFL